MNIKHKALLICGLSGSNSEIYESTEGKKDKGKGENRGEVGEGILRG